MLGNSKYDLLIELYEQEKEHRKLLSERIAALEAVVMEYQTGNNTLYKELFTVIKNHKEAIDKNTMIIKKMTEDPFEGLEPDDKTIN